MFDSELGYFLFLLFFFWVLEGIGKAMQKRRRPGQMPDGDALPAPENEVELPAPRPQPQAPPAPASRPRTLWEEIAEIARQHAEQQQAQLPPESSPRGPKKREPRPAPERRPRPAPRAGAPPSEFPPPEPVHGHKASSRWEEGMRGELARTEAQERAPGDERRSDRWSSGAAGEGAAPEGAAVEAAGLNEAARFEKTDAARRRADPLVEGRARATGAPAPSRRKPAAPQRGPGGRRDRAISPPVTTAAAIRPPELSLHNLRGASRAELRRLLILSEVLGPPVALREAPVGDEP